MLGKEGLVVFCWCCGAQGWPERCGWWRTPSCAAVKPEYPAAAAHCWLRHWSDRPRSPATGWCRLWSPQGLSSCLVPKQRIQNKDTTSFKDIVCTTMKILSSVTQLSGLIFSLLQNTIIDFHCMDKKHIQIYDFMFHQKKMFLPKVLVENRFNHKKWFPKLKLLCLLWMMM